MTEASEPTETPMTDEDQTEPAPALAAVDFTATELRLLLATPERELIASERYDLPTLADEEAWSWEIGGRLSTLFARDEPMFAYGVGVACPGAVHPVRGVMTDSRAQDGWNELHVVDALRRHIGAPTLAMDRVQAGLRGEMTVGAALDVNDAIYLSFREPVPTTATLAAGTVVRGAHHRPGLVDAGSPANAIASVAATAAMLDTALVILSAPEDNAEAHAEALIAALAAAGAEAQVVVSELGERAPLFGAIEAASIVAYEGKREE